MGAIVRKLITSVALATAVIGSTFAVSANASTITDVFAFKDAGNNVLADGYFSYDSSKSGVLGYGDLIGFGVQLLNPLQQYDLSFVNSLNPPTDYVYFGYDTAAHTFVPAIVPGAQGSFDGILAGVTGDGGIGFFFDPFPNQNDPVGNGGNDGLFAFYSPYTNNILATSLSISQTPLPSTWTMLIAGFAGLGFVAYRGMKRRTAAIATS